MNVEKTAKILSKALTALVSLRSLVRSGVGIRNLLKTQKEGENKKTSPSKNKDDKKQKQLHGALLGLGYSRPEADRALKELSDRIENDELPELIKAALTILNKK